jgi:hypothetical protein
MKNSDIYDLFRYLAITGNTLFLLWIWYNGIDERFQASPLQLVSYIGLTILLLLNSFLLYRYKRKT